MSKEKTGICKHCKSEIDATAKVCPVCRKKQGSKAKFIVIGIVAIVLICAISGSGDDDKPTKTASSDSVTSKKSTSETSKTTSEAVEKNEAETFSLGDTAEYKDVIVTFDDIVEFEGGEYNKPTEGNIFLLATFTIENNSDSDLAISSMMSFDAYQDGFSTSLSLTALIENENEQLDGTIAPGKKMKGSIGFEVPADYKEFEINFQPNVWASNKFVFVYKK